MCEPMTLRDLKATTDRCIELLELGQGSVRRSSAYHDYVALQFACFANGPALEIITDEYRALCRRHGWGVCRITKSSDTSVHVTMHVSEIISTDGSRRMPA